MLTFDVLCPVWAERADRRPNHVPRLSAHHPRGGANLTTARHRSQILVPPPVLSPQPPFPPKYPDAFPTFTPSIAPPPCPHTSVTAALSRPVEDGRDTPRLLGFAM